MTTSTGHELEELAKLVAARCEVDVVSMQWTEHGLLVLVRANGLVPMFCGETLERDASSRSNMERLARCAERAKDAAETWIDMMTAAGPVRVFASPKVQHDAISLDVDERAALFSSTRDRQTREQLERRAELEIEDAETRMREVELTKMELARRAS